MMRYFLDIVENAAAQTPVQAFIADMLEQTVQHPFDRSARIYNSSALLTVFPDIEDRATTAHISDIMAVEAGQRRGQGRDALLFLLQLADKHNVALSLTPKAYAKGPGSENFPKTSALRSWYQHYGFVRKHGEMIRKPGTAIPKPRSMG